jgi:heme ABC exporter ATP-binding subunit CcmA
MTDVSPAIQVRGLSKAFGRRAVFSGVSFDVTAGECVALTGANGAGKTTLLRCMASVVRPTAGEVRWFGRPTVGDPSVRRLIGMAAHEHGLYPHLTLHENLLFAARMHGVTEPRQRADELLDEVGLLAHCARTLVEISRGMRQRLALARAMVHRPRILFLDEPFASLDANGAAWLFGLLSAARLRGQTVCFAEHDASRVQALADRVLELRCGQVLEDAALARMRAA